MSISLEERVEAAAPAVAVPLATGEILTLETKGVLTRGVKKRRSVPIMGYVGLNGNFKTATMVADTLGSLAMGRRILSTVEILDPFTGNPHPLYTPFTHWDQLDDFTNGDILLDEVTGIMDSRDQGMPKKVRRQIPQLRRRNVLMRWTGIDWDNSDRRLRQLTQAVAKCRGFSADYKRVRADGTKDALAMWAPNRAAFITTYDAQTLTLSGDGGQLSQDAAKKKKARVLNREIRWMVGSLAFRAYDTLAPVLAIDNNCPHIYPDGTVCGLKLMERSCKGHDEPPARSAPPTFHTHR